MRMICLDLEGVLVPEIWLAVAETTGIQGFKQTTRDVADYDALMQHRLDLLSAHAIDYCQLQAIVATLAPLPGARDFLSQLRTRHQVTILSDTFYELAEPLISALGRPALFCHHLEISPDQRLTGWKKRIDNHKRRAVESFKTLGFHVMAVGDSYNDLAMLDAAHQGFLFRAPEQVRRERSDLPSLREYAELLDAASAGKPALEP